MSRFEHAISLLKSHSAVASRSPATGTSPSRRADASAATSERRTAIPPLPGTRTRTLGSRVLAGVAVQGLDVVGFAVEVALAAR